MLDFVAVTSVAGFVVTGKAGPSLTTTSTTTSSSTTAAASSDPARPGPPPFTTRAALRSAPPARRRSYRGDPGYRPGLDGDGAICMP